MAVFAMCAPLACVSAFTACSSEDPTAEGVTPDGEAGTPEASTDAAVAPDVVEGSVDAGPCGSEEGPCCAGGGCSGGLSCQAGRCMPPQMTELGQPCRPDSSDCATGSCLPIGGGQYACSTACAPGGACLAGWACESPGGTSLCRCSLPGPHDAGADADADAEAGAEPDAGEVEAEPCDGRDNDCDGVVDNPELTRAACVRAHGTGFECKGGTCACALSCNGSCVDKDTDIAHCGACDVACSAPDGGSAVCARGTCMQTTPLATIDLCNGITRIAIAPNEVYFIAGRTNQPTTMRIRRMPLAGGTPTEITLPANVQPRDISVDAERAYFSTTRGVYSMAHGSTDAPVLLSAAVLTPHAVPRGNDVFFFETQLAKGGYSLKRTAKPSNGAALTPVTVAKDFHPVSLDFVGDTFVYRGSNERTGLFAFGGGVLTELVSGGTVSAAGTDATNVFALTPTALMRVSPATGAASIIGVPTGGPSDVRFLAVGSKHLFVARNYTGDDFTARVQVERLGKTFGPPATIVEYPRNHASAIAVRDETVVLGHLAGFSGKCGLVKVAPR